MDLDEALDRLYAAPLDEFTATRNTLAKELGPDGATLKALKKPNLAAWALNQLARKHSDELGELYQATDRVRLAQRRVLSGGKPSALREATDARGKIVQWLTKKAGSILTESGHSAAPSTLAAVTSSLVAIAADEEGAELLRKGRLTRELHAESVMSVDHGGGLTLIEGDGDADVEERESDAGAVQAARTAVNEARDRLRETRKAAREAEAAASKRQSEADEAERAAKAAHESAEFAKRAADARRAEADDVQKALDDAQEALREAESD